MAYSGFQRFILWNKISKRFEVCRYLIPVFFSKFLFLYAACHMKLRSKIKENLPSRLHPNFSGIFLWLTEVEIGCDLNII
jgi:hypothetical protein